MSLEKKIRKMMHDYYRGSGCNPLFDECEDEVLKEVGAVANKIRDLFEDEIEEQRIQGVTKNVLFAWNVIKKKVLGLLVEKESEK